jgi:predicted RNA-binding protein YlxR (DUF448 family)
MAEDEDPEGHEVEEIEPQDAEKGPLRRCIVTRESLAKEDMLRFVVGPENSLVPDLAGRLPGRGMWLKAAPGVLEQALKKGAFHRAAKAQVKLPENFAAVLASMLEQRLVDMLGMARRAGESVAGWQKVQDLEETLLALNHLFAPACFDPGGPTDNQAGLFGHPR